MQEQVGHRSRLLSIIESGSPKGNNFTTANKLLFRAALRLMATLAANTLRIDRSTAFGATAILQLHDVTGARTNAHNLLLSK